MKGIQDDLRQAFVVSKNEFVKYLRGKKILILGAMILLIWGLFTAIPYIWGDGIRDPEYFKNYLGFMHMTIIIVATLFAADTISSEFESRTALVIFTRPIKKSSIYVGKFFAAMAFAVLAILVYYFLSAVTVLAAVGSLPAYVPASMMFSILTAFAATGIAVLFSTIMKRSGTAAILTFFTLLMFTAIIFSILALNKVDAWFMIDSVNTYILGVMDNGFTTYPSALIGEGGMSIMVPSYNAVRAVGVAIAWGASALVASFVLFLRKEL